MNEFEFLHWQFEQLDKYKLLDGQFTLRKSPIDWSYTLSFDFRVGNLQYRQSIILDIPTVDSPTVLKLTCESFAQHIEKSVNWRNYE